MKKFFDSIFLVFKAFDRARIASVYARNGDHKKATKLMQE